MLFISDHAMVELSKDYDSKLQTFERTYAAAPEDPVVLDEYCDFMEEYLQQGLLENRWNICREISTHSFFRRRSKQI